MGFPVGYSELFLPRLLINAASLLGFLRGIIDWLLRSVGLAGFLEPDPSWPDCTDQLPEFQSMTAVLIREILPVVRFDDMVAAGDCEGGESCAVCLYEFEAGDEIRRLTNCRHIFHRACLDRWMDHDQRTCPLCRTCFVAEEMLEAFNERLWAAAGIPDFYGDYSSPASPTLQM
ncbi:brassinosteroid-responsive RING protein 1 [Nymphaea colorata]|uniref:RING-type domain-containing protein n=1 Tax=Nymphaea colorata TaxID=210225 RepID=A0A5K1GYW1_9MAGN|nr:brassinosteroid-responsive RING protein 1 [Nymphaea colorata]